MAPYNRSGAAAAAYAQRLANSPDGKAVPKTVVPKLGATALAPIGSTKPPPAKWPLSKSVAMQLSGAELSAISSDNSRRMIGYAASKEAWRGDLLMVGAAFCMALYSIWSKPVIRRSAPLSFTTMGMGVGALCLILVSGLRGSFAPVAAFGAAQWLANLYLGIFGGAVTFFLWAFALSQTTPTRVAISVTVNPVTASLVGAVLLGEPLRWNLVAGIVTVFIGIWVATTAA